jgi:cyclophilin family peptidyl-prolyl cis-trans isomerase
MSAAKRKRQKEGRRIRQEALAESRARRKARRRYTTLSILVAIGIVAFLLVSRNGKHENASSKTKSSTVVTPTTSASPVAPVCPKADGSSARATKFSRAPDMCIDANKKYTAKMVTDVGTITIALDAKKAPLTVNNFVFLSRYHFYDGLTFHRVLKNFVVQGGDPTGTGSGGPGYQFNDELPKSVDEYKAGSLAMANSGPNTNGSQFFIVTSDAGGKNLGKTSYSLFGQVSAGMDVVKKIEADGAAADPNPPAKLHKIKTVTITES